MYSRTISFALVAAGSLVALVLMVDSAVAQQRGQTDGVEYVTNPVAPRVADPWVYRHTDGHYYLIGSVPAYDRIDIRRAETLQGLAFAKPVTVWRKHDSGPMSHHIWAPELHHVDGTWVIHFAAGRADDHFAIRMYSLTSDAENPLEGEWTERGQVKTNRDSFSLDATTFEHEGIRYLVWAQKDPAIESNTNLYIARMDAPWSITGEQVMISRPEYDWEIQGYRVNEGAAMLKKHGRIWLTYSASATDANYAMGLLWADEDADLLDPDSWSKSPEPVFTSSTENDVYGPGHNSFTTSKDGSYDILVYHGRPYSQIRGSSLVDPNRQTRMQVLHWADDGSPVFGEPVPDGPHVFAESLEGHGSAHSSTGVAPAAFSPEGGVLPFELSDVRLLESPFNRAQELNLSYLMEMDPDRLLAPYLREAGLDPRAEPYGNWESSGLDGHIGGHYLSALAMMYAATGRGDVLERLTYMIGELRRAQEANGDGYLGGVPNGEATWREIASGTIDADLFALNGTTCTRRTPACAMRMSMRVSTRRGPCSSIWRTGPCTLPAN